MLVMGGALSIIWGIAAVSSSHFFVAGASYILSDLNTWGWIVMGFGIVEILAALSIWRGGEFGRWFGILAAGLGGLAAMSRSRPTRSGRWCCWPLTCWSFT